MKTINTMNSLLTILIVLSLSSLVPAARERVGRPKPAEKAKAERQKVWSLSASLDLRGLSLVERFYHAQDSWFSSKFNMTIYSHNIHSVLLSGFVLVQSDRGGEIPVQSGGRGCPGGVYCWGTSWRYLRGQTIKNSQFLRTLLCTTYILHQTDQERFCFCGKKGRSPTPNWKFICGKWVGVFQIILKFYHLFLRCIKNKPFSFKIERPEKKDG